MAAIETPISRPDRRFVLLAGAAAATLTSGMARAQEAVPGADLSGDGAPFDRTRLVDYARALSKRPYVAPNPALPDGLNGLNYDQYVGIRHRPERAIWGDEPRGFILEPLHRGFVFQTPVHISLVEGGVARKLVYSPARYDFGKLPVPGGNVGDIGFSGVRILATSPDGPPREIAVFQGASFLRAIARGQTFGAMARALSLKTADPRGEEFPQFRALFIERPARNDLIIVHALLDSESVSGVFSYTIRNGDVTLIDTEAAIFPRVALDNVGLAGMQGTYLFSLTERRNIDDFRPSVYEVRGLQMNAGSGEWIWRPVSNPKQLQISSFAMENPRGFGFVMRDRDFNSFQDTDARFEARPTLWVEPIGEWGAGAVQLMEIPSENEIHDNILATWRPREPMAAGSEHFFAYRQHWCWSPPERPQLAMVSGTRIGRAGQQQRRRRFVVDFAGERLATLKPEELQMAFWASNNGAQNLRIIPGTDNRPWRVTFELDPGNETLVEMRLALMNGTAPVSETWLYRWTP